MDLLPKVFRTEGDMVEFDPSKIFESIIKETSINEKDAKHITELVVRRIISSGIKFLSGPHIREIVCSILSESHFEQERKIYTRIGMPLMDYEAILEKGPQNRSFNLINPEKIHHWAADQLAEEYSLLRILNDNESQAHLYGNIYIHQLKYFDLRPYEQIWDPRIILKKGLPPFNKSKLYCKSGPSKSLYDAISHLAKWLGLLQGEFCGKQAYNFITIFLAPYIEGLNDSQIKRALQHFIHEINHLSKIISKESLKSSISCSPTIINSLLKLPAVGPYGKEVGIYEDYAEQCLKIFELITEIFIEGDFNHNSFCFPEHLIYFNNNWLNKFEPSYLKTLNEAKLRESPFFINLCTDWIKDRIKHETTNSMINFGILQKISLNLPRYAYISKNESEFMEHLTTNINLCFSIFDKKYIIIKKRLETNHLPICSSFIDNRPIFLLDQQHMAISFVGLNEAVKFLTNNELHETNEAFSLGKKIINKIDEICKKNSNTRQKRYCLTEDASNKVVYRFARLDLKHFKNLAIPKLISEKYYYTNSTHFAENIKLNTKEELIKQSEFHRIIQNGTLKEISLSKYEEEFDNLKDLLRFVCNNTELRAFRFKKGREE